MTNQTSANFPPGPKLYVPLFFMQRLYQDPFKVLLQLARKYGSAIHISAHGRHGFAFGDPYYIHAVFTTHQYAFQKNSVPQRAKILLGNGLINSDGELHRRQRHNIIPALHRQYTQGYAATIISSAQQITETWQDRLAINISQEMTRLSLTIICRTLLSDSLVPQWREIDQSLRTMLENYNALGIITFTGLLDTFILPLRRRRDRALAQLDQMVYDVIELARGDRNQAHSVVCQLLDAQSGDDIMNDKLLRDEIVTLLLAGYETTSIVLAWSWLLIAQHPHVMRQFLSEIDTVFQGRLPTPEDLPNLQYTDMIFTEVLRMYPPVWAISRYAREDVHIGKYLIPSQSIVVLSQYLAHHNPAIFPNPDQFDPDRWRPEIRATYPNGAYFPFGGGAAKCIAESFAHMEGVLALATIAQRWHLEPIMTGKMPLKTALTLRPKYDIVMQARRR